MNATTSTSATPAPFWRLGLVVFLAVLVLGVPQAALLPLLDRDEPRFAEASREMLQSGNIVVPTFDNQPRYAKPPLIYWCQAIAFSVLGENAFAARLPSLLATAGTAVLLLAWGAQIGSVQMGLGAALAYAFCLQTVQQGRVATADALLIFFMTLTVFAGWKVMTAQHASGSSRSYFWDTTLALGFAGGFLTKGPEALLPLLPLLICARGIRRHILAEITVNLTLGLIIVLFWGIPAYVETHGDYWRVGLVTEGVGGHMATGLQGHGASTFGWYLLGVPLYLVLFWLSALPWSPLLLAHRKRLFDSWKPDSIDTYLLLNAGVIFLVFSLMVTKLPHYTLPAFPFLALAFARRWQAVGLSPGYLTELGWVTGIILALLTTVLVPVAIACNMTPSPVGELVRKAQPDGAFKPDTQFALVDFREPNAIWEMRRVVKGYSNAIPESEVLAFLGQTGPRAVVLSSSAWQRIQAAAGNTIPSKNIYEARGWNTAKGWDSSKGAFAFIDLTLVVNGK